MKVKPRGIANDPANFINTTTLEVEKIKENVPLCCYYINISISHAHTINQKRKIQKHIRRTNNKKKNNTLYRGSSRRHRHTCTIYKNVCSSVTVFLVIFILEYRVLFFRIRIGIFYAMNTCLNKRVNDIYKNA